MTELPAGGPSRLRGPHLRSSAVRVVRLLVSAMVLGACVDHAEESARFCDAIVPFLDPATDGEELPEETAKVRADAVAEEMRHAEDGRRPVREAARDLLEAYDEMVALLGDDEATEDELAETAAEIDEARVATRHACQEGQAG